MRSSRILVAPLNWGLGHASRCIPVIQQLLDLKTEVILAGDGESLNLLINEFPNLESVIIEGFNIRYPANGNMTLHFLRQLRKMSEFVKQEHTRLEEVILENNIDAVISDNRYGLYSTRVPCVLLTHQVNIQHPWFASLINRIMHRFIEQFSQCWVVDTEGEHSLAGILSKTDKLSNLTAYTGPLSRFNASKSEKKHEVIAILSGPEPQRSMLEAKIVEQLNQLPGNHLLIRGTNHESDEISGVKNNIEVHNILASRELEEKIDASKFIVSRSGYSSIMDYVIKGRNALLIPTPGQTEQEYLAKYHHSTGRFLFQKQHDLDLKKAINQLGTRDNPAPFKGPNNLKIILEDFCDSLN